MKTVGTLLFLGLLFSKSLTFAQLTTHRLTVLLELENRSQLNQVYYLPGETISGQAHIVDAATHQPDSLDAPLYIDWIDQQHGRLLDRVILKPHRGRASFRITLADSLPPGYYQIRAYTNWMRNFSSHAFGQLAVLVIDPTKHTQSWARIDLSTRVHSLQVGAEGGTLVAQLHNKLVICASDTFARGVMTNGFIGRDRGDTVAVFQTDKTGLTSFELTPDTASTYWLQAGHLRIPLTTIKSEGSVLRCDDSTYPDRLRITIENRYPGATDTLTFIAQNRGKVIAYSRIPRQSPVTVIYIARKALSEGITNLSLVDSQNMALNERMVYQSPLAVDSLPSVPWLNNELDKPISFQEARPISQALVLRHNTLFNWHELTQPHRYPFVTESGIPVVGQVMKWNGKSIISPVAVSLLVVPVTEDSLHQRQLLVTQTDTSGRFSFEGLGVYGTNNALLTAKIGNTAALIRLDSLTIPPIEAQLVPIDWATLVGNLPPTLIEDRLATLQKNRYKLRQLQGISLQAVTVKASSIPTRQRAFVTPPTVAIDRQKIINGGFSNLEIVLSRYFIPRLKRYEPHARYTVFVDDIQMFGSGQEPPPPGIIDHIDIHDGDGDANRYGVNIVLSIYTTFFTGLQAKTQSGKLFQLIGFQPELAEKKK